MRILILNLLLFITGSVFAQTDQQLTFSFYRGEKNLYFISQNSEKVIPFKITGINSSEINSLKQKMLGIEGIINFSIETSPQPGEFYAKAVFNPSSESDFFKDFFAAAGVKKVIVEDTELSPDKLFAFTSEQFKQIEKLNYQINQIEFKIDWVWQNEKEQATQNGWFDDAYNNLQLAKEAKTKYINSINN